MIASLHDLSVLKHHDRVRIAHGTQPVGDHENRSSFHELIHSLLDQGFRSGIHRRSSFIQYQYRGICHGCPGDGQELTLSLGQVCPVGSHHRIISLRQTPYKGICIGDPRCPLDLLLCGVQLSEPDIVGDGSCEQMGVLQHDAQRAAKRVFFDLLYIDTVVQHLPSLHIVKPVDQIGNRRLSGSRRTYKRDLLARMGIQADVFQYRMIFFVAKIHIYETDVSPQRHQFTVRFLPGPVSGPFLTGHPFSILLSDTHKIGLSFIYFRLHLHDTEYPFGACQRGQKEIALLGKLIDRKSRLAYKDQITCQAAHIGHSPQGHDSSQHRHNGIIHIRDADHRRDHCGSVSLRARTGLLKRAVLLPECLQIRFFMIKYFNHLLPADHFLDITVQVSKAFLLAGIIFFAPGRAEPDIQEHGGISDDYQKRQLPVQDKQKRQGSHDLDKTLDHHGKTVIQRVRDGIHVIGKITHDVSMTVRIKKFKRQSLQMGEKIPANIEQYLLRGFYHGLCISICRKSAHHIDQGSDCHAPDERGDLPVRQIVYNRTDHISTQQICRSAYCHQQRHSQKHKLVPSHIGQQHFYRISQIFRSLSAELTRCHYSSPPFICVWYIS